MMIRFKRLIVCGLALAATLLGSTAYALTDLTHETVTEDIKAVGTRTDGDYGPEYLFDDSYGNGDNSRWLGTFAPGKETSFTYIFKTPTVVNAVRLRVPAWNCNDRAPNDWTIFGSADEASWTQIHNQTDNAGTWAAQESRLYLFENEVAYKCYKIVINNIRKPSEGYVQLNEVEFYNTIRWTGAIDNDVTNPGNWEGNQVPGPNADVRFVGSVAPNIPADTTFAVASVYAQDVTLAGDCDWSGLTAPVGGKIDLKGHDLTVSTLAGDCEIADSTPLEQYDLLEYIQSSGAQYIDTEYTHASKTEVECVVDVSSAQPNGWSAIFGARKSGYSSNAFCFFAKCNTSTACYNRSGNEAKSGTYPKNVKSTLTCVGKTATWKTESGASGSITTEGKDDGGANTMFVFNLNTADAGAKKADGSGIAMKLYAFKISEDGVVKRDFVPAKRVRDGKVGLLDLANPGPNEFYVNQGTGADFTAGSVKGTLMGEDLTASDGKITLNLRNGSSWHAADTKEDVRMLIDNEATDDGNGNVKNGSRILLQTFAGCSIDYDFDEGNAKVVRGLRLRTGYWGDGNRRPQKVVVFGSQKPAVEATKPTDWTEIATIDGKNITYNDWSSHVFANDTAYRSYRLDIPDIIAGKEKFLELWEVELVPGATPPGELHVNVEQGATVKTGSVTLSGSLKVVKKGDGALDFSKNNQPFTGGIDVVAGKIYTSGSPSTWSFGGNGNVTSNATAITVNEGATFDLDGKGGFGYVTFNLNGGTIRGASNQFNAYVNLLADSYFETTGNTKIPWIKLYLNGFTLNVTIATSTSLYLADATIQNGTFNVVSGGTLAFNGERDFSTVDFKVGSAISVSAETSVHGYEWSYRTGQWNSGSAKLKVFGTFTPTTDCFYGCEMQDGSTLNLASNEAAWSTTGTATAGLKSVTFAGGATITIDVGERELEKDDQVVAWSAKPENAAVFKIVGEKILTDDAAQIADEGVFYTADPGAIVAATWTGEGKDGNVETAANWDCTDAMGRSAQGVPGAKSTVTFADEGLPDIKVGSAFTAAKVVVSDAVLAGDCDWRGLAATIPVSGKIDLKGHSLTVADLPAIWAVEITDTSATGSGGELHVTVAQDAAIENTTVALTGSLMLVKDGAGSFKATKASQTYTGGTVVSEGTLVYGTATYPVGSKNSSVTVAADATLDMNGILNTTSCIYNYDLAGTVQQYSADDGWSDDCRCFGDITLSGDAMIIGKGYKFANPTKTSGLITFNGHKLTFDIVDAQGNGGYSAFGPWCDEGVVGGTIEVLRGSLEGDSGYGCKGTRLVVSSEAEFKVAGTFEVGGLEYWASSWVSNKGTPCLKAYGRYLAGSMRPRLDMQNGSTLDLSAVVDGVWSANGKEPTNLQQSTTRYTEPGRVTFAANSTITVIPPDRLGRIVDWPSKPTGVTFKLVPGVKGLLEVKDDGLYLHRGMIITFR